MLHQNSKGSAFEKYKKKVEVRRLVLIRESIDERHGNRGEKKCDGQRSVQGTQLYRVSQQNIIYC